MRQAARRRVVGLALAALASGPAEASDRPQPTPALPHLGACAGASTGFLLPGTDACLTIGGFLRAEATGRFTVPRLGVEMQVAAVPPAAPPGQSLDRPALGTGARLTADLRIPTELGPVRVFVSLRSHTGAATGREAR